MKHIITIIFVVAVVTLSGCLNSGSGNPIGGVMKSEDAGRNFESKVYINENTSLARSNVLSLAIDPSNNQIVYAGTGGNDLYKSVDGAESWTKLLTGITNIRSVAINPFSTSTIYISGLYKGRGSVVKSVDGGKNWHRVYLEPSDGTSVTALVISLKNGEEVYIGTSGGTIARTKDGGETWKNLYNAQDSVNSLMFDGGDMNTIYALIGGRDIYKSRDGGKTFEDISDLERESQEELYEGQLYSMATSPSVSGTIVVGTDNGVYKSVNYGQTWTVVDVIASTVGIPIHAVAISPHDANNLVYAAAKAVYTSVPDGWAITDTTSNRVVSVITHDPVDSNMVYIGLKNVK
ncbi:MAG: hypothetical protein CR972_01370 [Candidatus Moraniibacteriota bacterium]|nr:MAG: hypothetical protein CR972_01370 [Candidatus Moranbacteria bacterium]